MYKEPRGKKNKKRQDEQTCTSCVRLRACAATQSIGGVSVAAGNNCTSIQVRSSAKESKTNVKKKGGREKKQIVSRLEYSKKRGKKTRLLNCKIDPRLGRERVRAGWRTAPNKTTLFIF